MFILSTQEKLLPKPFWKASMLITGPQVPHIGGLRVLALWCCSYFQQLNHITRDINLVSPFPTFFFFFAFRQSLLLLEGQLILLQIDKNKAEYISSLYLHHRQHYCMLHETALQIYHHLHRGFRNQKPWIQVENEPVFHPPPRKAHYIVLFHVKTQDKRPTPLHFWICYRTYASCFIEEKTAQIALQETTSYKSRIISHKAAWSIWHWENCSS